VANEKHILLTIGGSYDPPTLAGEIWECTLRFALVFGNVDAIGALPDNWNPVADTISRTETLWNISGNWRIEGPGSILFQADDWLNDQVAPAVTTWLAANQSGSEVRIDYLKALPVGSPLGRGIPAPPYAAATPVLLEWTSSNPTGVGSGTQLPPQNSIVASHRTGQVGARGRGRMFLPPATSSVVNAGKVDGAKAGLVRDAQIALLEGCAFDGVGVSAPRIRPVVAGVPYVNYGVITQVSVGNIMDTQRRRRNRLSETVTTGSVTY